MSVANTVIELTIHRDQLGAIETIDSVNRIEEYFAQRPMNDYARGILAQDWDFTSLGWPKDYYRYKGRGQIVTVADSGIDVNHAAFRDKIKTSVSRDFLSSTCISVDLEDCCTNIRRVSSSARSLHVLSV